MNCYLQTNKTTESDPMIPCQMPDETLPDWSLVMELLQQAHEISLQISNAELDDERVIKYRQLVEAIEQLQHKVSTLRRVDNAE